MLEKLDKVASWFIEKCGSKLEPYISPEQADTGMVVCFVIMILAVIGMMFAWCACFKQNVEEMRRRTKRLLDDDDI